MRPHLQNNKRKWVGGMAQVVEGLLCKCEALSSKVSPTKKNKKIKIRKLSHSQINGIKQSNNMTSWVCFFHLIKKHLGLIHDAT
jgi:hypothetical protein